MIQVPSFMFGVDAAFHFIVFFRRKRFDRHQRVDKGTFKTKKKMEFSISMIDLNHLNSSRAGITHQTSRALLLVTKLKWQECKKNVSSST